MQDLQHFLAEGSLDDCLQRQATLTAGLLGAASCSIMLLNSGAPDQLRMTVYARFGNLPEAALTASVGRDEGICGRVLASGEALLVDDIAQSDLAALAQGRDGIGDSLMCAPLRIDGKIVGVINVAGAQAGPAFGDSDLQLLNIIALFIGKSIQVQQLQRLLDSRFAQLALLQEARDQVGDKVRLAYRNPEDAAKILARSFFKEMTKAGFESGQIVSAATELIEQLNLKLKHPPLSHPPTSH
ncbi:GAF domain-containing protein [Massilia sp. LXY-6]|uniref:GAF domain-containing protein n=1 Tax=Massilia sp. LXY-6 TaxID=3379823 RepID=UPI003EE37AD5